MILRTHLLLPIFILFSIISVFFSSFSPWFTMETLRAEPDLSGPTGVCLSAASGFAYAEFNAAGDPTDVFNWSIKDATGFEVYNSSGQGLNKITFAFSVIGNYQVSLRVYRGSNQNYFQETLDVVVQQGPVFNLPPDVVLCGDDVVTITAVSTDPALNPNFSQFSFEWRNQNGDIISTQNEAPISEEGRYFVKITTPACSVEATTFAGPSIEVEVTPSTTVACLGQTVTYTPDIPISASWSYQKAGQSQRTLLGQFFNLNLDTDNLEGLGDYTIYFNAEDQNNPGCSVEQSFPLTINEGASFTLAKISDADECDATDGSFRITTVSNLDELQVNGVAGATYNQLGPNQEIVITDLTPRMYVVTGKLNGCSVSRTINIANENFDSPIPFTVTVAEEGACSSSGLERGAISLHFEDGPGSYSIYSSNGSETTGTFEANETVVEELPGGTYQIQVKDANNCTSPEVKTITVPTPRQVSFSVPATVTACIVYEFSPESNQDLSYEITAPDGSTQTGNSQSTFTFEESGTYSILATANDPASGLCPRRRDMKVTVNEQLEFDYSKRIIDCYGSQIFKAELGALMPSDVIIRWRKEDGVIVGRALEFYPPSTGNFTLDVQPRASSSCPVNPIPFVVDIPPLTFPVEISASSFCGEEPFSTLIAEGDFGEERQYQWFFTDSIGNVTELLEKSGLKEIDVTDEGTYEVVVRRLEEPMCELGRASYELVKSEGISLNLEDTYQLCTAENFSPTITPGDFASYNWMFEGVKVDSASTFRPSRPGNYELTVTDSIGCEATAEFLVMERCVTLVRHPNALIPGNPEKDFRIFVDPMIEEIEVFVYSRTGELIFHCGTSVEDPSQPLCIWDGKINGNKASVGTYPLIIRISSEEHKIQEEIKKSILVIE